MMSTYYVSNGLLINRLFFSENNQRFSMRGAIIKGKTSIIGHYLFDTLPNKSILTGGTLDAGGVYCEELCGLNYVGDLYDADLS